MIVEAHLQPWRCANPSCPSRYHGPGQIIMEGENRVGWVGASRCHRCHYITTVRVTPDGPEYAVRPPRNIAI